MDEILVQIGKRIFERRKQLRITQDDLAERADVTPQTISSAERGQKSLRSENLLRVSKALGVSSDYLLTGSITGDDLRYLQEKLSGLTPAQYRHLEDVIDSCIAIISEQQA